MPLFPMGTGVEQDLQTIHKHDAASGPISAATRIKNRRKRYLDLHPEYFSADLELAGPLALPV
jgi:hypothetical protein